MRKLHLMNPDDRDATVMFASLRPRPAPGLGLPDREVSTRRYLAATEEGLHSALQVSHGEAYAEALIAGDPEVDIEQVGRRLGTTDKVYLASDGGVLFAPPEMVEVVLGADGEEKARRAPEDVPANVNETDPLRWSKLRLKRADAVRRFAFGRTLQIRHADGLTYDYLFAMAKELDEADEMVFVGAGPRGRDALVFQSNGTPYRAFLEGRIQGDSYMLLMHLSNLELKRPEVPE